MPFFGVGLASSLFVKFSSHLSCMLNLKNVTVVFEVVLALLLFKDLLTLEFVLLTYDV